jgi:uncharacterized repeat protein (TIGR03847 family)
MSPSFEFEAPDHFTAGAVGPPGERVFYLQAREKGGLLTLKAEKEQVGALGQYLGGLLIRLGGAGPPGPDVPLVEPVTPAWAIGSLGVGYDGRRDRLVIEARELGEEDEEETAAEPPAGEPPVREPAAGEAATARFHITRAQAAAFVERAKTLLKGGRPACPLCSQPLDPAGHRCPRTNGLPPAR